MKSNYLRKLNVIVFILFFLLNMTGCGNEFNPQSVSGFYFDTFVNITVYSETDANNILNECLDICEHYDKLFNVSDINSDIYKINNANGKQVNVNNDTLEIIEKAIDYSERTNGLLDITIESVYSLWDFQNNDTCQLPDKEQLKNAVNKVNYKNIVIDKNKSTISLKNDAKINLGALAKGYIADKIKEFLIDNDINSAIINLGGNVLVIGSKPDGSDYHIGLQKPFANTGEMITDVSINDTSVVTSGIYQRYFEKDNVIYHHILNPLTGYPVDNDLNAVSIICSSSLDADAYSTICMLMGYEDGLRFINSLDDVKAIFIDRNNNIIK